MGLTLPASYFRRRIVNPAGGQPADPNEPPEDDKESEDSERETNPAVEYPC